MHVLFWVIALLVLSIVGLHWYYAYRQQKVAEVARRLGLTFSPSHHVFDELEGLYLTQRGNNPSIENCISGTADGIGVQIFEYRCTFGDVEAPASYTVALFTCDELDAPNVLVRPKHRIAALDPYAPIAPGPVLIREAFDRNWVVTGKDSQAVRKLFDDELIHFFQTNKWWMEADGSRLVLYRWNHTVNHASLERLFREGFEALVLLRSRCPATGGDGVAMRYNPDETDSLSEDGETASTWPNNTPLVSLT